MGCGARLKLNTHHLELAFRQAVADNDDQLRRLVLGTFHREQAERFGDLLRKLIGVQLLAAGLLEEEVADEGVRVVGGVRGDLKFVK